MLTNDVNLLHTPPSQQMAALLVCLLGSFRLVHLGQPLNLPIAGKAMALLGVLGIHLESGVPRDTLLDTLWPEQEPSQSIVSLNSLVYTVHRRLQEEIRDAQAVVYSNGSYFLNRRAGYSTDIACFDTLVLSGNRHAAAGNAADAFMSFGQALDIYRGDLCTGTDIYATIERERLRATFLTVLAWRADYAYRAGNYAAAMELAQRLLAYDPCREDAHRMVMRSAVRRGERAQAIRQYMLCERILRSEFDVAPETLTRELFDLVRLDPASV